MRARLGLAHALWVTGRRQEAVKQLQELLRLNPNDNQGVRCTLAGWLLFLDRHDELEQLLGRYPDEASAAWAYTRALLAFRRQGDVIASRRLLKAAWKTNKFVPAYLLGQKLPPSRQPSHYRHGDESEALEYIGGFMAGWKSTPGATAWLRANAPTKKKKPAPESKGPLTTIKTWLNKRLPQEEDVWQADFRQTPNWMEIDGDRGAAVAGACHQPRAAFHAGPRGVRRKAVAGLAVGHAGQGDAASGDGSAAPAHRAASASGRMVGIAAVSPRRNRRAAWSRRRTCVRSAPCWRG